MDLWQLHVQICRLPAAGSIFETSSVIIFLGSEMCFCMKVVFFTFHIKMNCIQGFNTPTPLRKASHFSFVTEKKKINLYNPLKVVTVHPHKITVLKEANPKRAIVAFIYLLKLKWLELCSLKSQKCQDVSQLTENNNSNQHQSCSN